MREHFSARQHRNETRAGDIAIVTPFEKREEIKSFPFPVPAIRQVSGHMGARGIIKSNKKLSREMKVCFAFCEYTICIIFNEGTFSPRKFFRDLFPFRSIVFRAVNFRLTAAVVVFHFGGNFSSPSQTRDDGEKQRGKTFKRKYIFLLHNFSLNFSRRIFCCCFCTLTLDGREGEGKVELLTSTAIPYPDAYVLQRK